MPWSRLSPDSYLRWGSARDYATRSSLKPRQCLPTKQLWKGYIWICLSTLKWLSGITEYCGSLNYGNITLININLHEAQHLPISCILHRRDYHGNRHRKIWERDWILLKIIRILQLLFKIILEHTCLRPVVYNSSAATDRTRFDAAWNSSSPRFLLRRIWDEALPVGASESRTLGIDGPCQRPESASPKYIVRRRRLYENISSTMMITYLWICNLDFLLGNIELERRRSEERSGIIGQHHCPSQKSTVIQSCSKPFGMILEMLVKCIK